MKKTRHSDEQIAFALKQAETGTPVAEVIRRMGISEQTFYRWKKVYGGLGVGELRRLKLLEEENRKLKQLVADLSLDKHILQMFCQKSSDPWTAARARRARPGVPWCQRAAQLPGARCRSVVGAIRVAQARPGAAHAAHPRSCGNADAVRLLQDLHPAAQGGWFVNHKRVYRLYRDDGLSLRLKRPRRNVSAANRERQPAALAANEMWSMDFVLDALFDGRRLRALTVVDAFTREALAIDVDQGIKGEQVVAAMGRIALSRGAPGDVTPAFHPAATRDRPVLSRMSAGEATGGVSPARCLSSSAANAAGVA